MKRSMILLIALAGLVLAFALLNRPGGDGVSAQVIGLQSLSESQGFLRADAPREWNFPQDHGPHPDYQTEWWYYTGNLDTTSGRHFGYQLTFFRQAIRPGEASRPSEWGTNQIYFAHFALTDVQANSHFAAERFSRGAAGLAGATGSPFRAWVENWQVSALDVKGNRVQLSALDGNHALDLTLDAVKPLILQGDKGLSPKSDARGSASFYYSFTRLDTTGRLTIGSETFEVRGLSWMDHEFGTTALGADAVGWDWFSIQLNDDRELMYFQIRRKDGSVEPLSGGTLVDPDGSARRVSRGQVRLTSGGTWTSPRTGTSYPARWSLSIPDEQLDLTLSPLVADQEMRVSIFYWEGAVKLAGVDRGAPVTGSGYVEMTGYAH